MFHRRIHGLGLVLGLGLWMWAVPCAAQDVTDVTDVTEVTDGTLATDGADVAMQGPRASWIASISAGIALTAGNSDSSTMNLAFDAVHDDQRRFVFTTSGLIIRGDQDDQLKVDRRWLETRFDARISEHLSTFVEASYLRDHFKQVNYLVTPTAGLAFKARRSKQVDLAVDASLGAALEKNQGRDMEASPAFSAGERLAVLLGGSARITQSFRTIVKLNDLGNVFYTFATGLAASVTEHSELKAELIDTFKNEPPDPTLVRNDVSILVSIVYKF